MTTPYNVIRVFTLSALGIPAEKSFALRVDPGRLVVLRDDPSGWQLLSSRPISNYQNRLRQTLMNVLTAWLSYRI